MVVSFNNSIGGIRSNEASGDSVMNAMVMCVFSVKGVDRGPRSPPPVCNAEISVPDESQRIFTSLIRIFLVPPVRISFPGLRISSFFMGALPSLGSDRMYISWLSRLAFLLNVLPVFLTLLLLRARPSTSITLCYFSSSDYLQSKSHDKAMFTCTSSRTSSYSSNTFLSSFSVTSFLTFNSSVIRWTLRATSVTCRISDFNSVGGGVSRRDLTR